MTNIKTMMEELAQEELERDGAACREVMQSRKGAGAERHGKMRLIDANALLEHLYSKQTEQVDIALEIADFPAVDAIPVDEHRKLCHEFYLQGKMEGAFEAIKHGQWIDAPYVYIGANRYVCDQCSEDEYWKKRYVCTKESFCPNCGALMDGDTDET